jgi:hypothetical protein
VFEIDACHRDMGEILPLACGVLVIQYRGCDIVQIASSSKVTHLRSSSSRDEGFFMHGKARDLSFSAMDRKCLNKIVINSENAFFALLWEITW